jgi:hypothetical protein
MLGIPYDRFELCVPGTVDEVVRSVRSATGKPTWFNRGLAGKRFIGSVGVDNFRLSRIAPGKNTYMPLLLGRVRPYGTGHVSVSVVAMMHPGAAMLVLGTFAWVTYLSRGHALVPLLVGFVLFHVGLCAVGFVPEVKKAQVELLSTLQRESQA